MANATLAGVLAGFMINALILLLSNKPKASSSRYLTYVQSAALLFAAFVALGLDSYLFGLVTGESTATTGMFSTCRRAWTEAMFAAGLLAVGAVAVIAGFVLVVSLVPLLILLLRAVPVFSAEAEQETQPERAAGSG